MPKTPLVTLLLSILLAGCAGTATRTTRTLADAGPGLSSVIPLDPAVRTGTLDNGVTYYIRANRKPENRAQLRVVVNAGSVLEDDDQRGLAHFVEHMAFNGTENFEKQELIDYLERIGMRFGPDINAYTSLDETVYMLEIPTDDEEIVHTGFQILEDWAHGVLFEAQEIDDERGVVIEEWRQGRGAGGRIRDKQFPVLFHNSRYAERLVIGTKESLESAPYEAVHRFYRDWYRPDLIAVVAVGDFDEDEIERLVREHFSRVESPQQPRARAEFPIPDHEQTLFSVVTDPEATSIRVVVGYKRPPVESGTLGDLRESLVETIYHYMMIGRLQELAQRADPPFQYGFAASGTLGRSKSIYQLSAVVRDGGVQRGLETLLTEARRVEVHGFTSTELARTKVEILRDAERQYEERDKLESAGFAGGYVQHFLDGDPFPSIEYYRDAVNQLVPGIKLEEVNELSGQWITEHNRVILVSGPETDAAGIPDEAALLDVFDAVSALDVTPWVDEVRDEPLVQLPPEPGRVVAEETIEELELTLWTLSNGATVMLKPTDNQNDEIVLRGYSPGGHSLSTDDEYLSAVMANSIVAEMGAGQFSRIELGKALAGKVAGVHSWIGELAEGISASASPTDVETMFELLYLRFTGARRDEQAFEAYMTRTRGWLENQEASPGYWFGLEFAEQQYQDHPRRGPLTLDRLEQVRLDQALAFYRRRFADASDFLFTLVGNLDPPSMRPLVERWIGGLPGARREETWRDVGVEMPGETIEFEVNKGIEPKSQVRIVFHGEAEWSPAEVHLISSVAAVLRIRLREVLREELGGVYGVRVSAGIGRYPKERFSFSVSFGCDPERVGELRDSVFEEIELLVTDGPAADNVEKVRESQLRNRETNLESNTYWASILERQRINDLPLLEILAYEQLVDEVSVESIRSTAERYLANGRYVQGILYPQESTPAGSVP